MTYVSHLNSLLRAKVRATPRLVAYGQNITAGSCLSGLTRGLEPSADGLVLNTPNSENTLVAAGFGLALRGVPAVLLMKQQDFLLLGLDHLVNTWNIMRLRQPTAGFSIVTIVVDSGFEGPQSRLNKFADFCSMAEVQGYAISNAHDAETIVERQLTAPGCRIIGVSQRLFGKPELRFAGTVEAMADGAMFRYASGNDVTIVAFNFALPQAAALREAVAAGGLSASLFSINAMLIDDWGPILADVARTGRLVVVDDSRSSNRPSHQLRLAALGLPQRPRIVVRERGSQLADLAPQPDEFSVDAAELLRELQLTS